MTEKWRPVEKNDNLYIFQCPHCDLWTEVDINQVNCHIFRHAFYYEQLPDGGIRLTEQIPPHSTKNICDQLIEQNKVVGCAKPFRFVRDEQGEYRAEQCGYI